MQPCNLLVPSADSGGMPAKIKAGSAIKPPPPARVSINPASMAMKNKNDNSSIEKLAISNE